MVQSGKKRIEAQGGANSVLSNDASITKAQAQSSGLGYVAQRFDQIDAAHTGRVSTSDVRQYDFDDTSISPKDLCASEATVPLDSSVAMVAAAGSTPRARESAGSPRLA